MKRLIPIVLTALLAGCEKQQVASLPEDVQLIEERIVCTTPAETSYQGESQTAKREVVAWSAFQWNTPATELGARQQPMQVTYGDSPAVNIGHDGVVTSGGKSGAAISSGFKWTFADTMMVGLTRIAIIAGIVLVFLFVISIIPGLAPAVSGVVSFAGRAISWAIPFVGGLFESLRAAFSRKAFTQVVDGGQTFKARIKNDTLLSDIQKEHVLNAFRDSQEAKQDDKVQKAVREYKGK